MFRVLLLKIRYCELARRFQSKTLPMRCLGQYARVAARLANDCKNIVYRGQSEELSALIDLLPGKYSQFCAITMKYKINLSDSHAKSACGASLRTEVRAQ